MKEPIKWSDELAAKTIALQVKEIDRLQALLAEERRKNSIPGPIASSMFGAAFCQCDDPVIKCDDKGCRCILCGGLEP